ncbi:hypothetical protein DSO57_1002201 [Entomophthora muscae]|uniref:Uncharacterized protein n=2 Tax=Entomophthora muscae TaxID=34485 RepID=A0ACC2U706_9FUNG|nr:hypothetical protein DSO57_1018828 [Entomophthora muscae]KAJ9082684.1 hypothetical protein DSO57_1002201 [Entomophthora muscae]
MCLLPPISLLLSTTSHPSVSPPRSSEDNFQLSRFKLDFTPSTVNLPSIRHRMSLNQTNHLEYAFSVSKFPSRAVRIAIAHLLGVSPRRIQVWFQNKRQKHRTRHTILSPHSH